MSRRPEHADYTYTVKGHWPFPLDMLRKDRSQAATPEDQAKIDLLTRSLNDLAADGYDHAARRSLRRDKIEVNLVIPQATPFETPVVGRWESFSWEVVGPSEIVETYQGQRLVEQKRRLAEQGLAKLTQEERDAIRWLLSIREH